MVIKGHAWTKRGCFEGRVRYMYEARCWPIPRVKLDRRMMSIVTEISTYPTAMALILTFLLCNAGFRSAMQEKEGVVVDPK